MIFSGEPDSRGGTIYQDNINVNIFQNGENNASFLNLSRNV